MSKSLTSAFSGLDFQQVLSQGYGHGFGSGRGTEFGEDDVDMVFDAVGGDFELAGDLLVG